MGGPKFYWIILIVMFGFLLLSPFKGIILIAIVVFGLVTIIRYLYWRNEFDYER